MGVRVARTGFLEEWTAKLGDLGRMRSYRLLWALQAYSGYRSQTWWVGVGDGGLRAGRVVRDLPSFISPWGAVEGLAEQWFGQSSALVRSMAGV